MKVLFMFIGLFQSSLTQDRTFLLSRQSFAIDLFKNLSRPESFIISPASIDFAVSALFFGSSQQTFMEMMTGLHFPKNYSMNMIQNNFMLLSRNLKNVKGLEIGTIMYVNESLTPQHNYKLTIQRVLNAEIESIAFAQNVQAAQRINSYVAQKTHNMIMEVIDQNAINSGITMILLNCIYFKGTWQYKFLKKNTFTGKFFLDETNTVPAQFMTQKTYFSFGYIEELNYASVLSLPYKNSDMTMLFVLPRKKDGLPSLISNMSMVDWSSIDKIMGEIEVKVTIPKFNISFEQDVDGTLKNVSVASREMEFIADHPFIFMLRAKSSILFIGQYTGDNSKPFVETAPFETTYIPDLNVSNMLNME
ncbi:unnamed protein product [Chironomus riparius]|uniref:Serpin domain-containing protein n=1 Tax=Chironomus riparius TaxID=315576 RepID=A0A9N9WY78_9DIPT|nr:unnamed protein product [Chironomus riparius]